MPLDVTQLPLGPIQTNCYLVRHSGADEAVVVDPSADATEIRLELARRGARCTAILITHGHWDHLGAVADLAGGTSAPVHMAEAERDCLERINEFTPAGVHLRPYTPDVLLSGGETVELAGMTFETLEVPGHSAGHLAYAAEGVLFSGDVLFARLGSGAPTSPDGLGHPRDVDQDRSRTAPAETHVYPGHGPATTLGDELARTRSSPSCRTVAVKIEAPRGAFDVLPADQRPRDATTQAEESAASGTGTDGS